MNRAPKQSNLASVLLTIDRLFLNVSFKCNIKALVKTNRAKKNSSSVPFDVKNNRAIFNQRLNLQCDPDPGSDPKKKNTLKITLIILKGTSTKMVGFVEIDLADDPVKRAGGEKYLLKGCPQKNVALQLSYEYKLAAFSNTVNIRSLLGAGGFKTFDGNF